MTERRGYYDLALYFPYHITLGRLYRLVDRLDEMGIDIDYATIELASDGLYCEAKTYREDCIELVESLGDDVLLDWDTMSEWDTAEEESE